MRCEGILENGKVQLTEPLNQKHPRVRVQVLVPDDELIQTNNQPARQPLAERGSLQEQLNQLLGSAAVERPDVSPEADREAFTQIMEERDQYRNE